MKSSKNCKVTAAFLAAAALGGVAHQRHRVLQV